MAEIVVQAIDINGANVAFEAAAASQFFANDGKTVLKVANGSGSSLAVTLVSQVSNPAPGTAVANKVVNIPAGETWDIGFINQTGYNDQANGGVVNITWGATASITVAAVSYS